MWAERKTLIQAHPLIAAWHFLCVCPSSPGWTSDLEQRMVMIKYHFGVFHRLTYPKGMHPFRYFLIANSECVCAFRSNCNFNFREFVKIAKFAKLNRTRNIVDLQYLNECTPFGYVILWFCRGVKVQCFPRVPTAGQNAWLLGLCWSATFVEGNLLSTTNFTF